MTTEPVFDIRKSVHRRNTERMIVIPILSVGMIFLGIKLIPESFVWSLSLDAFMSLDAWSFIGLVFVFAGLGHLIKLAIFAVRARHSAGEWHFRLTDNELLWQVPDHAHGPETGFRVALSDIRSLEFRTIQEYEKMDEREYWIHFHDRDSIQLRDYTGVSLSWLVAKINEAGVPYSETTQDR